MSSVPEKIPLSELLLKADEKGSTYGPPKYSWPRDVIAYDLQVHCLDSNLEDDEEEEKPHYHLAHCFPLYALSPFFAKAIFFSNQGSRPLCDIKKLKLPFRCSIVSLLIDFAYDGELHSLKKQEALNDEVLHELLEVADYTLSDRLARCIIGTKKMVYRLERDNKGGEQQKIYFSKLLHHKDLKDSYAKGMNKSSRHHDTDSSK